MTIEGGITEKVIPEIQETNDMFMQFVPEDVRAKMEKGELLEPKLPVQLPLWPETARIIPNHIARSALFAPIRRGARKSFENERLPSRSDVAIHYIGKQLDMADQDVFLQVLELFKYMADITDKGIIVNRADLLRAIGKSTGNSDYKWLEESMLRLSAGILKIETKQYRAFFQLISSYAYNKETKECKITLHPEIKKLFSNEEFGYINWNHSRAIKSKVDLAKWLQTYISAHQKGEQIHRIDTIHQLCGSGTRINDFRNDIKEALSELVRVEEITRLKLTKDNFSFIKK